MLERLNKYGEFEKIGLTMEDMDTLAPGTEIIKTSPIYPNLSTRPYNQHESPQEPPKRFQGANTREDLKISLKGCHDCELFPNCFYVKYFHCFTQSFFDNCALTPEHETQSERSQRLLKILFEEEVTE
jgi:hypothetical protein